MAGTKRKQSVRGMVLSLGVIGLVAGIVYFLFIPHDDHAPDLKRVDYRVELITARRAAAYPVAAPEGLSGSWKATSVRYEGEPYNAWHLGFQDPEGQYVAIEQSTQKAQAFIDDASQGGHATKVTQTIGGQTWQRYSGGRYDALVLQGKGSTTVVTGTATFTQLTKMAEALKTG
ncbi:DUF4245 domain-containing protein [Streptomyces sp. NPDC008222]|uniref:DUF4245 domain-containing protein n=1 Tax=Streptomyces sp. NPDC008222 TaxID=3364820 RepID=UPI0036EAFEBF